MLENCEIPSKFSQKRKISMENVYWMVQNDIKIILKKINKRERDWNYSDSQFGHVK